MEIVVGIAIGLFVFCAIAGVLCVLFLIFRWLRRFVPGPLQGVRTPLSLEIAAFYYVLAGIAVAHALTTAELDIQLALNAVEFVLILAGVAGIFKRAPWVPKAVAACVLFGLGRAGWLVLNFDEHLANMKTTASSTATDPRVTAYLAENLSWILLVTVALSIVVGLIPGILIYINRSFFLATAVQPALGPDQQKIL